MSGVLLMELIMFTLHEEVDVTELMMLQCMIGLSHWLRFSG